MPRRAPQAADAPRRATIRDVAARAGVSVATVSRILAGSTSVTPATRNRVMRVVGELDYVVNAHARALAGNATKSVAIVLNSVVSPAYAAIAQGVQTQAAKEERLCLISTTGGDQARELATVKFLREQHVEAVILVGNVLFDEEYRARMGQYAHSLAAAGSQLVLCARPPLGPNVPAIVVNFDNTAGAFAIASHLLSAGHERILYLGRRDGYTTADGRVEGYRSALAAHGIPHDPDLELVGRLERSAGYQLVAQRLARGPRDFTAVFGANDLLASGARQALLEHRLRIPDDVSLVGYDDLPPAQDIGLTTVHVPHEELGRTAVRLALQGDSDGRAAQTVLGTHIVVRDSVRARQTPARS